MKKVIIIVIVVVLLISGAGYLLKKNAQSPEPEKSAKQEPVTRSLLEWLKLGQGVECIVPGAEGEIKIQSKGEKVKISGIPYAGVNSEEMIPDGYSLTDGDWMYIWGGNEGTKINIKRMNELAGEADSGEEPPTWDERVSEWEEADAKYNCENKAVSDEIFTPPADVEFVDLTVMMEGFAEMGKTLEEQAEGGGSIDMDALEAQMKQLEEQYGTE